MLNLYADTGTTMKKVRFFTNIVLIFCLMWMMVFIFMFRNNSYNVNTRHLDSRMSIVYLGNYYLRDENYINLKAIYGSPGNNETSSYNTQTAGTMSKAEMDFVRKQFEENVKIKGEKLCPVEHAIRNTNDLLVCGNITLQKQNIVLFSTIYNEKDKNYIFNNTIHVWSSLMPDITPVLYISDLKSFIQTDATIIILNACLHGWTVLFAPQCNKHGFPVFKEMFNVTMATWDSDWYGFSNGDMLFDKSLISSLSFLKQKNSVLKVPMIMGRRYGIMLSPNETISHYKEVHNRFSETTIDSSAAVDYFITSRNNFPWNVMPEFVIGRPVYDTWLIWYATKHDIAVIDLTVTVRAVHQLVKGGRPDLNGHKNNRVKAGFMYNQDLAKKLNDRNKKDKYYSGAGYLSCVPLKLIKMDKDLFQQIILKNKIYGRGMNHYPIITQPPTTVATDFTTNQYEFTKETDNNRSNDTSINNRYSSTSKTIPTSTAARTVEEPSSKNRIMLTGPLLLGVHMAAKRNKMLNKIRTTTTPPEKLIESSSDLEKLLPYEIDSDLPVSYVPDSDNFIFVLVKRKAYLLRKKIGKTNEFKYVEANHYRNCHAKDHIDREVAELVTF